MKRIVTLSLMLLGCSGAKLPPVSDPSCALGARRCHNNGLEVCSSDSRWHLVGDAPCPVRCEVPTEGQAHCAQ